MTLCENADVLCTDQPRKIGNKYCQICFTFIVQEQLTALIFIFQL